MLPQIYGSGAFIWQADHLHGGALTLDFGPLSQRSRWIVRKKNGSDILCPRVFIKYSNTISTPEGAQRQEETRRFDEGAEVFCPGRRTDDTGDGQLTDKSCCVSLQPVAAVSNRHNRFNEHGPETCGATNPFFPVADKPNMPSTRLSCGRVYLIRTGIDIT